MTYDTWKATNPDDEFLGNTHQDPDSPISQTESTMYRKFNRKPEPRQMYAKFAGTCHCCGAAIKAGEWITYYPAGTAGPKGVIAHVGGLDGNSARCAGNIAAARDPGYVDLDRAYEDQCADFCGR